MLRQPIVTILGHVDHGKTSLLDKIRGSAVAAGEAGGITQAIGASIIPLATLKKVCGALLTSLHFVVTIPGLLFIDTPGHAVFTNLRKRGGNLADIAIVVIDIKEGVMPQTKESVEILKSYHVPFVIALNKIDTIQHWHGTTADSLLQSIGKQDQSVQREFETLLYNIVGTLSGLGFNADRFDRVDDFTKAIAIVPLSARTGQGIPELLMVLTGLAQKYLESSLNTTPDGPARGTILEVKEEKGLGTVLDAIIYDGTLKANDTLVIGGVDAAIITKAKALLIPSALADMRERKTRFTRVQEVHAAMGVRISATHAEQVIAGVPFIGGGDEQQSVQEVQKEIEEVLVKTNQNGVIIKADTLGSLEALSKLLQDAGVQVKKASVGTVTKKDLSDAEANIITDPFNAAILCFNIPKPEQTSMTVFCSDVIYRLLDDFKTWQEEQKIRHERKELTGLVSPAKITIIPGYVFRQSNPAVVGIEVMAGKLMPNTPLMKQNGEQVAFVKEVQNEQKALPEAKRGSRVSIALPDVIIGRHLKEGDVLYSSMPEEDFRKYKELKETLTTDEKELLKEIAVIMRQKNPVWGV